MIYETKRWQFNKIVSRHYGTMKVGNNEDAESLQTEAEPEIVIRKKTFLFHHSHKGEGSSTLEDHYKLGSKIADGAFGDVFGCALLRDPNVRRVVKRLEKKHVKEITFANELSALRKVDHPNLLRLYESFEDEEYYYIVTEAATYGNLCNFLNDPSSATITEAQIKRLVHQVLVCVNHCHHLNIIHCDIKPENILLDRGDMNTSFERLILCDFGFAQFYRTDERLNRLVGTPHFWAPEVFRQNYGPKCDVWSCGVLAFLLFVRELPFDGKTAQAVCRQVMRRQDHFENDGWSRISKEGKTFVEKLLAKEEKDRPTAQEALNHPWFRPVPEKGSSNAQSTSMTSPSNTNIEGTSLTGWDDNLIQFSATQKLKQATYALLVAQLTFKSRIDVIFRKIDTNSDGVISRKEIEDSFRQNGKLLCDEELEKIFQRVDIDQSGSLNYWEFLAATMNSTTMLCNENLEAAFEMFDKDNSNSITADDLRSIFRGHDTIDQHFSDDKEELSLMDEGVLDAIIQQVDEDGNGEISYEEFSKMMQETVMSGKRRHDQIG